jgi:serine protease
MIDRLGIKGLCAASIALALSVSTASADAAAAGTVNTAKFNVSSLRAEGTYDSFIVRYRDGSTEQKNRAAAVQSAGAAMARAGLGQTTLATRRPAVSYSRKLATGSELVTVSRKLSQAEATAFIQSLASDPAVAYVAPDVLRHAFDSIPAPAALASSSFAPNDQYFARLQTDYLPGDGVSTPFNRVPNYGGANITGAWNLSDGSGATIAVLDTGIVKHADVNTSLADAGYDFLTKTLQSGRATNGRVPGGWDTGDWTSTEPWLSNSECVNAENPAHGSSWHGTHVASAAGAEITNNGVALAGIAYNAKVIPVRVLGHCGGPNSDIADAIVWAAGGHVDGVPDNPNPAQVINLSLGGPGTCPANDEGALAIAKANALGATVVVAAGNSNMDVANTWPASCPGAITVAAVGVTSRRTFYSNYNGPGESIVALAAFGGGVFLNDASGGLQLNPEGFAWQAGNNGITTPVASPSGDTYLGMAGTSQAAPHVTGTVALMQSARIATGQGLLTPAEVKSMLQITARAPNVSPEPAKTFGAGILDAGAAVAAAGGDGSGIKDNTVPLSNGVLLRSRSGAGGSIALYKLDVPAGATALNLRTLGGTGDVSIYVKAGSPGSATDYDYKSVHAGSNSESVAIGRPVATTYYLTVVGESFYSGLNVVGIYSAPK